jgi:hypothetical protein
MLASLANRGKYTFNRQKVRRAGSGVGFASGNQSVTWAFPYMTQTEWDWLADWLAGAPSVTLSFLLWDDGNTLCYFETGELYRPTYDRYSAGLYREVTVTIDCLAPLL